MVCGNWVQWCDGRKPALSAREAGKAAAGDGVGCGLSRIHQRRVFGGVSPCHLPVLGHCLNDRLEMADPSVQVWCWAGLWL